MIYKSDESKEISVLSLRIVVVGYINLAGKKRPSWVIVVVYINSLCGLFISSSFRALAGRYDEIIIKQMPDIYINALL